MTEWLTNRLTAWLFGWLINRQTAWLTSRLIDWLTNRPTDRLTDWPPTDRPIDRSTDRLTTDQPTDWLTKQMTNPTEDSPCSEVNFSLASHEIIPLYGKGRFYGMWRRVLMDRFPTFRSDFAFTGPKIPRRIALLSDLSPPEGTGHTSLLKVCLSVFT